MKLVFKEIVDKSEDTLIGIRGKNKLLNDKVIPKDAIPAEWREFISFMLNRFPYHASGRKWGMVGFKKEKKLLRIRLKYSSILEFTLSLDPMSQSSQGTREKKKSTAHIE
jgi:hypothetical protein